MSYPYGGMPRPLPPSDPKDNVVPEAHKPMTPDDVKFWDLVLDNWSGEFIQRAYDQVEAHFAPEEDSAEPEHFEPDDLFDPDIDDPWGYHQ